VVTKTSIAKLVVDNGNSAYQVAKDTSIPHRSVVRYASYLRKGIEMKNGGGRPSKIDDIGLEKLQLYVLDHPTCSSADLKSEIKRQAVETYCRHHKLDIESISDAKEAKKISSRTVAKYLYRLKPDLKP
jgi:transposase